VWIQSGREGVTHGLATEVERCVEGGYSWLAPCWGLVLSGEVVGRDEHPDVQQAVNVSLSSFYKLREILMQTAM
jgi:hypothetical protein